MIAADSCSGVPRARPIQPPGPRGFAAWRAFLAIRRDRIRFVEAAARAYGPIVGFRFGGRRLFLVSSPEGARQVLGAHADRYRKGLGLLDARPLLGEGLLTADGSTWAADRAALDPLFERQRVHALGPAIAAAAHRAAARWSDQATIDVGREMRRMTLDVLGGSIFHHDLRPHADRVGDDLAILSRWSMAHMTAIVPLPIAVPTPRNVAAARARARLTRIARSTIAAACGDPAGSDLVSCLRGAPAATAPERRVRDHVLTMLLAGHETTAAALTWTCWLLASHPDVEAALHDELERAAAGRPVESGDLPRLTLTRAIVEDSLRLFPPVWLIPRRAVRADVICGYPINPGNDVLVCTYLLHRDANHWRDPARFDPARFAIAPQAGRHPWSYLPFGAGARACIGRNVALMETVLAVAAIAQRVRLTTAGGEAPVPVGGLTLQPRDPILLRVSRRRPQ
jgi:cytochrome P450